MYLNNTSDDEVLEGIPAKTSEYIIKTNDNLYVDIQSMSPEVNAMFNPTKGMSSTGGTSQNARI